MASKLSIWNRALQKLGSEKLVTTATNNKRARALDTAYIPVRNMLLEQFPWNFAKKLAVLTPDGTYNPQWKYARQYILPADCLAVVQVDSDLPYEVMMPRYSNAPNAEPSLRAILSDEAGRLSIQYISEVENEELFSPLFEDFFSTSLAHELCEELTQSNTKKENLAIEIRRIDRLAKATHSKQRSPTEMEDGSWWEARN